MTLFPVDFVSNSNNKEIDACHLRVIEMYDTSWDKINTDYFLLRYPDLGHENQNWKLLDDVDTTGIYFSFYFSPPPPPL